MVRYGCIKGYNENLEYYGRIVLKKSVILRGAITKKKRENLGKIPN